MFTMYYYLLILINRKVSIICLTILQIALNLLPLLSVFSSTSSQLLTTFQQLGQLRQYFLFINPDLSMT